MYKTYYIVALLLIALGWVSGYQIPQYASLEVQIPAAEKKDTHVNMTSDMSHEVMVPGGKCNIEKINNAQLGSDSYPANHETQLKISGWMVDDVGRRLPSSAIIRFKSPDHVYYYETYLSVTRQDVIDHHKLSQSLLTSGFEFSIIGNAMEKGDYSLVLILKFNDLIYVCDNGRKVDIR